VWLCVKVDDNVVCVMGLKCVVEKLIVGKDEDCFVCMWWNCLEVCCC